MIRINLLPSGKKRAVVIPPVIMYGIAALVVLFIIMTGFAMYQGGNISDLEANIFVKEQKLNQLKVVLTEVKNYERDNDEFRKKTAIIEQLTKNQIVPLRLLDEVSAKLPKGVWLTELTDRGGAVSIKGYAFSNSDLVGYVQNLKESKYFVDVMLVESRQDNIDNYSVYKFTLTFKVKV